MIEAEPFILTFQIALLTTLILFVIGLPISYWFAFSKYKFTLLPEAMLSLPLILPPSVLGFYLLLAFSPANTFGKFLDQYLDITLVFTFQGLVVASVLYSLPFMIQPLLAGFRMLPPSLAEASYTLGKDKLTTLFKVLLPNMTTSLVTGCILTFAHTIGEFGVVLMVGGNIPGETRVLSIAIYDEVEAMNYASANKYSIILLVLSFAMVLTVYLLNFRVKKFRVS